MADIDAVKDVMVPLLERMLGGFDQVHVVDVLLVLVGPAGGFLSYEFVEANADKAGKVHIFHIDPFSRVVSLSQPPAVQTAARQFVEQTFVLASSNAHNAISYTHAEIRRLTLRRQFRFVIIV
jgi:hypothetical protein